ncbi:MAG: hypothetical protein H6622_07370 [Halobacteriovoraceae bacterium]|nr:hypothetical protein [Halobacteriovoraceae bacterium]
MKFCIYLIILTFCTNSFAQSYEYLRRTSLIDWKELEPDKWLSAKVWQKRLKLKESNAAWRENLRDATQKELVGRILHCVGQCIVAQSGAEFNGRARTKLYEGDDLITEEDSYAWIFLIDGSMVRLSANTSFSLREVILTRKEFFFHARVNFGNVYWLSRDGFEHDVENIRETDVVFLPLPLLEANERIEEIPIGNELLYDIYANKDRYKYHYKRLNEMIHGNNEFTKNKPTYVFLIMPNGTMMAKNPRLEVISLFGGKSYIKNRVPFYAKTKENVDTSSYKFLFRGFENKNETQMKNGYWYEIDQRGRSASQLDLDERRFRTGEFLTRRIPTILMAREIWLKKYSKELFDENVDPELLSSKKGYQLWAPFSTESEEKRSELDQRVAFLKEYTRRLETNHLRLMAQYIQFAKANGEKLRATVYDANFYKRAMGRYSNYQESDLETFSEREVLNSTKKLFWKLMHAK